VRILGRRGEGGKEAVEDLAELLLPFWFQKENRLEGKVNLISLGDIDGRKGSEEISEVRRKQKGTIVENLDESEEGRDIGWEVHEAGRKSFS
jgi:hypothetical protein